MCSFLMADVETVGFEIAALDFWPANWGVLDSKLARGLICDMIAVKFGFGMVPCRCPINCCKNMAAISKFC